MSIVTTEPRVERSPAVLIDRVSKVFGYRGSATVALEGLSLEVRAGEMVCLVGASGCGKTTLLNLVAGLDEPSAGQVTRPGGEATLMFQDAALFPWLTAHGNVELALRLRGIAKAERRRRAQALLESVHLGGAEGKRPHELSGGMRQRVALARALAQERPILLMDEPFGALDAMTRDALHDELERQWTGAGLTVLFVTHNVREAVRLGDRVVLLASHPGRVVDAFEVPFPRPRRIESPEVAMLAGDITDRLRDLSLVGPT